MNPVSEDIKDILESISSLGLALGDDLFIGRQPGGKKNCVVILDVMGLPQQLTFDKTEIYEYPSIQIRVKNNVYLTGWNLINDIKTELHGRGQETWNGTLYSLISCEGGPALLEWDEDNYAIFIMNLNVQRR